MLGLQTQARAIKPLSCRWLSPTRYTSCTLLSTGSCSGQGWATHSGAAGNSCPMQAIATHCPVLDVLSQPNGQLLPREPGALAWLQVSVGMAPSSRSTVSLLVGLSLGLATILARVSWPETTAVKKLRLGRGSRGRLGSLLAQGGSPFYRAGGAAFAGQRGAHGPASGGDPFYCRV